MIKVTAFLITWAAYFFINEINSVWPDDVINIDQQPPKISNFYKLYDIVAVGPGDIILGHNVLHY